MWKINPLFLCKKHLLGEHGEIHKHRHNFEKKHSISGRIFPVVQIEPWDMERRHDELAEEMLARGGNHKSSYFLPDLSYLSESERNAEADIELNILDLISRCPDCECRISEVLGLNSWGFEEVMTICIDNQ